MAKVNPSKSRHLPAGVWVLGWVSLLMDISSEMIHSLLPVFLMVGLGVGATLIGVIEGVAEATASTVKIFSGRLSDYLGRRKILLLIGYGLAALTKPLFPLADSALVVLAARFIDRIGKGIRGAPRDALIADLTPAEKHGAAYGLRQSLDTIGALAGPLIALGLMAASGDNFRLVFWLALPPALFAVVLIAVAVREPDAALDKPAQLTIHISEFAALGRAYWWLVAMAAVLAMARMSEGFILLRAADVGLPVALVPLALIVMNLVYLATAYPAGRHYDRLGARGLIATGIAVLMAAQLSLAFATLPLVVFVGAGLWGLQLGLTQGVLAAMVAGQAPAHLRGTAFGLFHLVSGLAMIPGNILAGALWELFSPMESFLAGAGFSLAAVIMLLWPSRVKNRSSR